MKKAAAPDDLLNTEIKIVDEVGFGFKFILFYIYPYSYFLFKSG